MAGTAITVRPTAGDNLMLHRTRKLAARDHVRVVAANGEAGAQRGYLAALYAERIGLAGVVVHGAIRDVDARAVLNRRSGRLRSVEVAARDDDLVTVIGCQLGAIRRPTMP